ncbi:MAG: class I SAM-dependent methyltransferase [Steroidobacteraceae bacterium]
MPATQQRLMRLLYGHDVWTGFNPRHTSGEAEGWNGNHASLKRLASAAGTNIVVDVGVWKGQSTITLAQAMKKSRIDGCVIAVDTFLGSAEHWKPEAPLFTRLHGMPDIFQTFLSNACSAGVKDYIVPMPQTSSTAASILQRLQISAAVVHIDAAHEYEEVLRDAAAYWQLLEQGGYLIGDDYHETWPGVVRAAGEFSARVGRPLTIEPPKWILQKT